MSKKKAIQRALALSQRPPAATAPVEVSPSLLRKVVVVMEYDLITNDLTRFEMSPEAVDPMVVFNMGVALQKRVLVSTVDQALALANAAASQTKPSNGGKENGPK